MESVKVTHSKKNPGLIEVKMIISEGKLFAIQNAISSYAYTENSSVAKDLRHMIQKAVMES